MHPNLSDPAVEPSDDDLVGLAKRAFANVRASNADALRKVEGEIERERAAVLKRLDAHT